MSSSVSECCSVTFQILVISSGHARLCIMPSAVDVMTQHQELGDRTQVSMSASRTSWHKCASLIHTAQQSIPVQSAWGQLAQSCSTADRAQQHAVSM